MDSFRLWSRGIVISVIVTVVIEMILPENNSKKYIKIVLGIFIVYSIISPIFEFISNSSVENIAGKGEMVIEASSTNINYYNNNDQIEANKESSIRNIYSQSLQTEITTDILTLEIITHTPILTNSTTEITLDNTVQMTEKQIAKENKKVEKRIKKAAEEEEKKIVKV